MRYLKYFALLAICMFASAAPSHAQRVVVGVGVGPAYYGPAPVCAYGYYDYYPYPCAPYGYYDPDWFVSGVFIGAGPWFHGYYGRRYYSRPGFYGRAYYGRGFYGRRDFDDRGRGFERRERFEHRGFRDGDRGFGERFDRDDFRHGDRDFHRDRDFRGGSREFHGSDRGHGRGHR